jgi:hypothetical protein
MTDLSENILRGPSGQLLAIRRRAMAAVCPSVERPPLTDWLH